MKGGRLRGERLCRASAERSSLQAMNEARGHCPFTITPNSTTPTRPAFPMQRRSFLVPPASPQARRVVGVRRGGQAALILWRRALPARASMSWSRLIFDRPGTSCSVACRYSWALLSFCSSLLPTRPGARAEAAPAFFGGLFRAGSNSVWWSRSGCGEAAVEGDVDGVESRLPAAPPALPALAGGDQAHDGEVHGSAHPAGTRK